MMSSLLYTATLVVLHSITTSLAFINNKVTLEWEKDADANKVRGVGDVIIILGLTQLYIYNRKMNELNSAFADHLVKSYPLYPFVIREEANIMHQPPIQRDWAGTRLCFARVWLLLHCSWAGSSGQKNSWYCRHFTAAYSCRISACFTGIIIWGSSGASLPDMDQKKSPITIVIKMNTKCEAKAKLNSTRSACCRMLTKAAAVVVALSGSNVDGVIRLLRWQY